jgi:hypothetical protein
MEELGPRRRREVVEPLAQEPLDLWQRRHA